MKSKYYVSSFAQLNGDHEVHHDRCRYLPSQHHRIYLGEFESCSDAVKTAKGIYLRADGCYYCSNACHKR